MEKKTIQDFLKDMQSTCSDAGEVYNEPQLIAAFNAYAAQETKPMQERIAELERENKRLIDTLSVVIADCRTPWVIVELIKENLKPPTMKEQTENNKVIAEFMGLSCVKDEYGDEYEWLPTPDHSNWCFASPPPYDRRWDWLMPVVEKIRKSCWDKYSCTDKMGEIFRGLHMTDIERTYKAVIQFITWYNQQN